MQKIPQIKLSPISWTAKSERLLKFMNDLKIFISDKFSLIQIARLAP